MGDTLLPVVLPQLSLEWLLRMAGGALGIILFSPLSRAGFLLLIRGQLATQACAQNSHDTLQDAASCVCLLYTTSPWGQRPCLLHLGMHAALAHIAAGLQACTQRLLNPLPSQLPALLQSLMHQHR